MCGNIDNCLLKYVINVLFSMFANIQIITKLDPAHNLQYSSDSDECEMNIDHNTIPQNAKNSDALSDTDTASFSSIDEMPSATASG
ncbi:hypothetical protein TNIN_87251 [Trichonephila inaurata madagascariensis]|uniref:Uncharacterized protein n=1 Tax=Trichonephila inaurata madagascariensis TaxID=2747483 RepID=A0A8X6X7B9_9ARAC|nr:hypothetical protein TNIN_87251 [Trichonephila inaurata madagascariensis]